MIKRYAVGFTLLLATLLTLTAVPIDWRGPVAVLLVLSSLGIMRLAAAR